MQKFLILSILLCLANISYAQEDLYGEERILRPFHMGEKLCNPTDSSWDDTCEDFLFQNIFGEEWKDIKKLVLAFQRAVVTKDPKYLKKYLELPMPVAFRHDPEHRERTHSMHARYNRKIYSLAEFKKYILDKLPDHLVQRIRDIEYKDVRFENGSAFVMLTGNKKDVIFLIDHVRRIDSGDFHYIPKIDILKLDFKSE